VDITMAIALHYRNKRSRKTDGNWKNRKKIRKKKYMSINVQITQYINGYSCTTHIKKINNHIKHDRFEDNAVFGLIGGL